MLEENIHVAIEAVDSIEKVNGLMRLGPRGKAILRVYDALAQITADTDQVDLGKTEIGKSDEPDPDYTLCVEGIQRLWFTVCDRSGKELVDFPLEAPDAIRLRDFIDNFLAESAKQWFIVK